MKKLRLGLIGLGRAGYGMHLPELKGKEDMFEIYAVCDIEPDRCENMAKEYGCKTYARVEDIVEDPDVDVIVVATRSCDHFKHAKTALDAGKLVFLEKPMCTTYSDAKQLMEIAEQYGERRVFVRHNRRFEAKFMQLNRIIESGILGDVYYIKRSVSSYDRRCDWQTLMQYGGGQLLNWGPHLVDQALQFCGGDYKRMMSVTRQIAASGDCEDYVSATFEGINGRQVVIEISGGTALKVPEYVVYGSRGTLYDNGATFTLNCAPEDYVYPPVVSSPHTPEGAMFHPSPKVPFEAKEVEWETNSLDQTYVYLYEAIVNGKDYPIKTAEALKVMETLTAIKEQNV